MAKNKTPDKFTELGMKVTNFDACAHASLNINLLTKPPIFYQDYDLAQEHYLSLKITAESIYPSGKVGDIYELEIIGKEMHRGDFLRTLNDYHDLDENGHRLYKKYRGKEIPVYKAPPGIATLSKRRGERIWDAFLWLAPNLVTDMLTILMKFDEVYISILEYRKERTSWIRDFSLQTTDPIMDFE